MKDLGKYDIRPPIHDIKRLAAENPGFSFAFKQVVDKKVSPEELIKFLGKRANREKKKGGKS